MELNPIIPGLTALMIVGGLAWDRRRSRRWRERWIDRTFGMNISPAERAKIRAIYFPPR